VAHAFNPRYLGGGGEEHRGLKPDWAKNLQHPTEPPSQSISWAWWYVPVTPALWEA
jgi:hypothetical protein